MVRRLLIVVLSVMGLAQLTLVQDPRQAVVVVVVPNRTVSVSGSMPAGERKLSDLGGVGSALVNGNPAAAVAQARADALRNANVGAGFDHEATRKVVETREVDEWVARVEVRIERTGYTDEDVVFAAQRALAAAAPPAFREAGAFHLEQSYDNKAKVVRFAASARFVVDQSALTDVRPLVRGRTVVVARRELERLGYRVVELRVRPSWRRALPRADRRIKVEIRSGS